MSIQSLHPSPNAASSDVAGTAFEFYTDPNEHQHHTEFYKKASNALQPELLTRFYWPNLKKCGMGCDSAPHRELHKML